MVQFRFALIRGFEPLVFLPEQNALPLSYLNCKYFKELFNFQFPIS
jgi:hypothetical protein